MTDHLLGTGFFDITSKGILGDAVLLTEHQRPPWISVPLRTDGIDGTVKGQLIARVIDTSTVPGLEWRSQDPEFVSEGEETVIATGYPHPARLPFQGDHEADTVAVWPTTAGATPDPDHFRFNGILHSRIELIWRDHASDSTDTSGLTPGANKRPLPPYFLEMMAADAAIAPLRFYRDEPLPSRELWERWAWPEVAPTCVVILVVIRGDREVLVVKPEEERWGGGWPKAPALPSTDIFPRHYFTHPAHAEAAVDALGLSTRPSQPYPIGVYQDPVSSRRGHLTNITWAITVPDGTTAGTAPVDHMWADIDTLLAGQMAHDHARILAETIELFRGGAFPEWDQLRQDPAARAAAANYFDQLRQDIDEHIGKGGQ